ncbi:MAG: glycosyltransferase family 2 protein, partial [Gemmataceae bacterium]|nr:glycosyltransferase family 2 protein [Gemmataceae bacterium]
MSEQAATPVPAVRRKRPVVSACIVNWNCREQLRACLRSLARKRHGLRLEVLVVDNASTDGAAEMVQREFPRVVLIRNGGNAGYARACNQAAERARGRWLLFLNNDTVLPPGSLRALVRSARAVPGLG